VHRRRYSRKIIGPVTNRHNIRPRLGGGVAMSGVRCPDVSGGLLPASSSYSHAHGLEAVVAEGQVALARRDRPQEVCSFVTDALLALPEAVSP
jgi:hypothetical protein